MQANKRIDSGIKRGPKNQRTSVLRRRDPETGRVQGIPPNLDPQHVLDLYLTEQTTSKIAEQLGVTRKSLVAWMRETVPKEWQHVQVIRALCRKEDADEGLECATDALSLARAREMLRSGQWDLERLDSANYGQKQEVNVTASLTVGPALVSRAGQLLEQIRELPALEAPRSTDSESQ